MIIYLMSEVLSPNIPAAKRAFKPSTPIRFPHSLPVLLRLMCYRLLVKLFLKEEEKKESHPQKNK
jgi:hypothetical protein